MKTETLYRPKNETAENILKSEFLFESVAVPVGEFYIKKYKTECDKNGEDCAALDYEKVTHALPKNNDTLEGHLVIHAGVTEDRLLRAEILNALGETDESQIDIVKEIRALRDDSRKASDLTLKIGDMIHEKIELQKKVEELVKELDSWKKIPANEGRVIRESIEGQKETIESQKHEIDRLESENEACFVTLRLERESTDRLKAELEEAKAELESETKWVKQYYDEIELKTEVALEWERKFKEMRANLEQTKADLAQGKSDLEEAKNCGVVWKENKTGCRGGVYNDNGKLQIFRGDYRCEIEDPMIPQPRTIDDEAQEAFANSVNTGFSSRSDKNGFIAGFKAAKEGARE